jgi:hypothetical protein
MLPPDIMTLDAVGKLTLTPPPQLENGFAWAADTSPAGKSSLMLSPVTLAGCVL